MKTTRKLLLTGATAAVCASFTVGSYAQLADSQKLGSQIPDARQSGAGSRTSANDGQSSSTLNDRSKDNQHSALGTGTATDHQGPVSRANKASSLIGMDVRNTQNEKLGEIKDIVVDLPSGKVMYTVLSVGGFLGIGDKFVAVPPKAYSLSPEQDRLVLNADKAKIENAPGFAKNTWPDLNSWGAESAYWMPEGTAQGTSGTTVRTGTGSDSTSPHSTLPNTSTTGTGLDRDRNAAGTSGTYPNNNSSLNNTTPNNSSLNNSSLNNATPNADDRTKPQDQSASARETFHGKITRIDPETRMMTIEGQSGTRDFKFSERPNLTLKDSRNPRISDLKVGFPVTVGYHEENGTYIAHSVMRSDTPEVR